MSGINFSTPITKPSDSATVWRRFMGMVYEALLLFGPFLVIGFLYSFVTDYNDRAAVDTLAIKRLGLQVVLAISVLAYFVWSWSNGRVTLPMQTLGLKLKTLNGRDLDIRTATIRALLAMPSVMLGIGFLWAIFDRDSQALHDRLAGTRLIYIPVGKIL